MEIDVVVGGGTTGSAPLDLRSWGPSLPAAVIVVPVVAAEKRWWRGLRPRQRGKAGR